LNQFVFALDRHARSPLQIMAIVKLARLGGQLAGFVGRRGYGIIAACALALLLMGCQRGSEFPNRPITLICPWSPGGGTDLVSRHIASLLEQELKTPVSVINATGGAGVTGHTRGAIARPDGYTITMITVELSMMHWQGLTSISHQDFRPVVLLNRDAAALFVRAEAPWKSMSDLAAHVRSSASPLKSSGTARGGIWHMALAGWLEKSGLGATNAIWISINGAAPSLQELMAGGVDVVCCSLPEAKALLEGGRIRCLGVMSDDRIGEFPEVATFREQGIEWSSGGWRGLAVPKGTPEPEFRKLAEALGRIVRSEEYRSFMKRTGFNWSYEPPEVFGKSLEQADASFGELLRSPAFASMRGGQVGPMFFPGLLSVLFVVIGIALWITRLPREGAVSRMDGRAWLRMAEVVGWVAAYMALAEWLGFVVTVGLLLGALLWRYGSRLPLAMGISFGLAMTLYQLFAVMLRVSLPQGWVGW
jgi:tripartite-type tricarboxylate transporter receptor subunit TctC